MKTENEKLKHWYREKRKVFVLSEAEKLFTIEICLFNLLSDSLQQKIEPFTLNYLSIIECKNE